MVIHLNQKPLRVYINKLMYPFQHNVLHVQRNKQSTQLYLALCGISYVRHTSSQLLMHKVIKATHL